MTARTKTKSVVPAADPADAAAIEAARAEVDAGKTVSYERVRRWLLSWGTKKELPRPRWK
jgi:predicted transcriptional regulator